MAKKNNKNNKNNKNAPSNNVNIVFPDSLSAAEMQQIIANALIVAEETKAQIAKQQKECERKSFRESMGYKDYSKKKGIIKLILIFLNRVKMFFNLLFAPKHLIQGDAATLGLLRMFIEVFFWLAKVLTTLFSILCVAYIPLQFVIETIPVVSVAQNILLGCYSFASFLLSRMFRMASIEINKIEDRNLLFSIFASVASIVSIVIAVIAIVR